LPASLLIYGSSHSIRESDARKGRVVHERPRAVWYRCHLSAHAYLVHKTVANSKPEMHTMNAMANYLQATFFFAVAYIEFVPETFTILQVCLIKESLHVCPLSYMEREELPVLSIQWLQWGVTFSQVVWLIGC